MAGEYDWSIKDTLYSPMVRLLKSKLKKACELLSEIVSLSINGSIIILTEWPIIKVFELPLSETVILVRLNSMVEFRETIYENSGVSGTVALITIESESIADTVKIGRRVKNIIIRLKNRIVLVKLA